MPQPSPSTLAPRTRTFCELVLALALVAMAAAGCGSKTAGGGTPEDAGAGDAGGGADSRDLAMAADAGGGGDVSGDTGAGGTAADSAGDAGAADSTDSAADTAADRGVDAGADTVADAGIDSAVDAGTGGNDSAPDVETDAGVDTTVVITRDGGLQCTNLPSISTCLCSPGGGDSTPCSVTSVINGAANQAAVCCNSQTACSCQAFSCRSASNQYLCACGVPALVNAMAGLDTPVASCPLPTGSRRCCLSTSTNQCTCVPFDCDVGEVRVDSCTPSSLAVCGAGQVSVASCN